MAKNAGVVIPSYNEVENVCILSKKILTVLPTAILVIVDDSRKEENEKLHKSLGKISVRFKKNIIIISRLKKLGRGSAVIEGLKNLLKNNSINYFFEMDADLAHDPRDFENFFKVIDQEKADVVMGSRYLSNSKIIKWPMKRLILSKIINIALNAWLGLRLSDYTNGFRLYNRKAVKFLTEIQLRETGFILLSEIAFRLRRNNFKISEVPICFTDRKYGKSSADYNEYVSAILGIIRIKVQSFRD